MSPHENLPLHFENDIIPNPVLIGRTSWSINPIGQRTRLGQAIILSESNIKKKIKTDALIQLQKFYRFLRLKYHSAELQALGYVSR